MTETNVIPIKKIGRPATGRHVIKRFTVALTAEQYIALNNAAVFEGQTMTAIIRRAVVQELCRIRGRRYD